MNHGPAFMVDGPGTVDRDDAIRIDTAEDGSRTLAVFVADVTGAIDADPGVLELALSRGATIYRRQIAVQAMLPPEIERAYTLAEGEARRALAIRMPLGEDGLPGDPVIERCVLEHAVALTHQDAGIAVKDRRHPHHKALLELRKVAEVLFRARYGSACAFYDLHRGVFVDEDGKVVKVRASHVVGHLIVQEAMIAANRAIAEWAVHADVPIIFRNHAAAVTAPPPAVQLEDLSAALRSDDPDALGSWMARAELTGRLARYDAYPRGHHGLAIPVYTHATSPLRRAADLITQHAIVAHLEGRDAPYAAETIAGFCERLTVVVAEARAAGSEAARKLAHETARRILDADAAYRSMTTARFFALIKRATKEGISSLGFLAEVARRADADLLEQRDLYHLLLLPSGVQWTAAKTACLGQVGRAPENAVSLVAMYTVTRGVAQPAYRSSDAGADHRKTFTVTAEVVGADGSQITGAARTAATKKSARGQAALSLLALLAGVPDPSADLAAPEPVVAPEPASVAVDGDAFAVLNRARQLKQLGDVGEKFEQLTSPTGAALFAAHLTARLAAGGTIEGRGMASTKKAAKALAAAHLVSNLKESAK